MLVATNSKKELYILIGTRVEFTELKLTLFSLALKYYILLGGMYFPITLICHYFVLLSIL